MYLQKELNDTDKAGVTNACETWTLSVRDVNNK